MIFSKNKTIRCWLCGDARHTFNIQGDYWCDDCLQLLVKTKKHMYDCTACNEYQKHEVAPRCPRCEDEYWKEWTRAEDAAQDLPIERHNAL